jgi:hypothetical protein
LRSAATGPLVDHLILHDDLDVRQRDDIEQRVAVDDDDVGNLPGLDGTELAPFADDLALTRGAAPMAQIGVMPGSTCP